MDSKASTSLAKLQISSCEPDPQASRATTPPSSATQAGHRSGQCCQQCEALIRVIRRPAGPRRKVNINGNLADVFYGREDIEESIRGGCPTCRIFLEAVLHFSRHRNGWKPPESIRVNWAPRRSFHSFRLTVQAFGDWSSKPGATVELHAPEDVNLCDWPLRPPPFSTSTAAKLAQIDKWLQQCRKSHVHCRLGDGDDSREQATPLPKRVLDISSPDGEIRLHEPQGTTSTGRYICLSHCWGDSQPLTTSRSTLESRKRAIPWDTIPPSFQDVVTITRKLGVRFLWIDSLCIIQDDHKDWAEQAPAMCAIYRGAFLTIAATRCEGCHDRLLPTLDQRLCGTDEKGNPLEVVLRVACPHLRHWGTESAYSFLERAWIFQERLLSRRVVHFGFDEVFWECMESTSCQCDPEDVYDINLTLPIKSIRYRQSNPDAADSTLKSQWRIWHEIVDFYTHLQLTYATDRPAAILGLAREMEPLRKGLYMAGVWEDNLPADLAWYVDKYHGRFSSSSSSRCRPTWSWTSISFPCYYSPSWVDGAVEVVVIESPAPPASKPHTQHTNSKKSLGAITLRGRVFTGTSDTTMNDQDISGKGPTPGHTWLRRSFACGSFSRRGRRAFYSPDIPFNTPFPPDGQQVFCLAIGFDATKTQHFDVGLVLQCVDEGEQLYERLGIVRVEGGGADPKERRPGGGFDGFHGLEIKTITLI
ncbi:heterokaryon incompatibility protein-domain-containing protein [Chaetomium strumarium]|uniref:Heterokaryon incompatibility protein-domain-containing protein n=1 Tax=Chaetomium strumarium TaxID=1170767 RepID=A0AAJ0M1A1_9PEZI|nr:heterokaryon incompatibility protein-domain-containing protein [Chaetomium strumarium]